MNALCRVAGLLLGVMGLNASMADSAWAQVLPVSNALVVPREPRVPDPSTIIKDGEVCWFFCTGNGVNAYRSRDLTTWERSQPVFAAMPAWHREVSTYAIRVGRSREITGPCVDKDCEELMQGGGTMFLATDGAMIGPGHAGIFSEGGRDWLGIHFYDGAEKGRPAFALRELTWSAEGWPVAGAVRPTHLLSTRQTPSAVAP